MGDVCVCVWNGKLPNIASFDCALFIILYSYGQWGVVWVDGWLQNIWNCLRRYYIMMFEVRQEGKEYYYYYCPLSTNTSVAYIVRTVF